MKKPEPCASIAAIVAIVLLMAPAFALAAGSRTYEGVLVFFLAVSALVLLVWAVYYFSPVHRHFIRCDRQYKRVLLPLLGVVAVALGVTSVIIGEVSFGRGSSVVRAFEPGLFWRYIALQIGAGCLLIVIGLLYRPRDP